jgi:hypothetical protein
MHGEKRHAYRILGGKPEGERPGRRLDVGGRIMLNWILENRIVRYGED